MIILGALSLIVNIIVVFELKRIRRELRAIQDNTANIEQLTTDLIFQVAKKD